MYLLQQIATCLCQVKRGAFLKVDENAAESLVADCATHQAKCKVFDLKHQDTLCLHVAGLTCTDFSSMGHRMRWLGPSIHPCLQWLRERLMAAKCSAGSLEQIVVIENVLGFEEHVVSDILTDHFSVASVTTSPKVLGLPADRQRKYIIFVHKSLQWHEQVLSKGHQEAYNQLFAFQSCHLCGDVLLRAGADELDRVVTDMAKARHLPATTRTGRPWSWFQCMSPSLQSSLVAHEEALKAAGHPPHARIMTNLQQRPAHMGPVESAMMPALLRSSTYLWSFHLRRGVTGLELFEVQGHTIYDDTPYRNLVLKEALAKQTESELRKLSGNSMHLACVGTILMFALATTQPVS